MYHEELRRDPVYQRALHTPSVLFNSSTYYSRWWRDYEDRKALAACKRLDHLIRRAVHPYKKWIDYNECSAILLFLEILENRPGCVLSWANLSLSTRRELEERIAYCRKVVAQCHEESRLCGTPLVTSAGFRETMQPVMGHKRFEDLILGFTSFDSYNPTDLSRALRTYWD
jgi:hypothetical protein